MTDKQLKKKLQFLKIGTTFGTYWYQVNNLKYSKVQ